MDYIYGQLNTKSRNTPYTGKDNEFFRTEVYDTLVKTKRIVVGLDVEGLLRNLKVVPQTCSNEVFCSDDLMVGKRLLKAVSLVPSEELFCSEKLIIR